MNSSTRYQLDLSTEQAVFLEELMAACGIKTKKELFNNAVTLLEWAVKETQQGHTIASVDEATQRYRELQMPILATAARKVHAHAAAQ